MSTIPIPEPSSSSSASSQYLQHATVVNMDLPPDPPSYEVITTTLPAPSTSLLPPAPAYNRYDQHDHGDDVLSSLAIPGSSLPPLYQQQQQQQQQHPRRWSLQASPPLVDELPGYVAMDQFEPPWTLPNGRCIKYTVLAHHEVEGLGAGVGRETPAGGGGGAIPSGSYLHEVVAHQPPIPRSFRRRIQQTTSSPSSTSINNNNNNNSASTGSTTTGDDNEDGGNVTGEPPSAVYKRTSAWALEYWCEDTIMYLYFPVEPTQSAEGGESPSQEQNDETENARSQEAQESQEIPEQQQEEEEVEQGEQQQQQQLHQQWREQEDGSQEQGPREPCEQQCTLVQPPVREMAIVVAEEEEQKEGGNNIAQHAHTPAQEEGVEGFQVQPQSSVVIHPLGSITGAAHTHHHRAQEQDGSLSATATSTSTSTTVVGIPPAFQHPPPLEPPPPTTTPSSPPSPPLPNVTPNQICDTQLSSVSDTTTFSTTTTPSPAPRNNNNSNNNNNSTTHAQTHHHRHHHHHHRNRAKPIKTIPTFTLVAANDPMTCVWTSRVDDKLVEHSLQTSTRDQVLLHWRARGGGTGDEKLRLTEGVVAGCQHEWATCLDWVCGLAIWQWQPRWWRSRRGRVGTSNLLPEQQEQQQQQQRPQRQQENQEQPSSQLGEGEQRSGRRRRRERASLTSTKKERLLRVRLDCEIMFRVRGQYYAWRDVTEEKLLTPPPPPPRPIEPPRYLPLAMTIQSPLPSSSSHTLQRQVATAPVRETDRAESGRRGEAIAGQRPPTNTGTATATTTTRTTPTMMTATTKSSNARMFALYRDDHFDVDKKCRGYCVAEVWVVHEESAEDGQVDEFETGAGDPTQLTSITTATTIINEGINNSSEGPIVPHAAEASTPMEAEDSFPASLRRRKCMIRIKQNLSHDVETFILTTGPRLPDLFNRIPRRSPITSGHTLMYAVLVMSLFLGWGLFFLTKKDLGLTT
ncbi:hypothetical protein DFQ27_005257 [Actinomortierella ambigua]|uniref:Uncharacterized protein n=1 Tax=Actinomortierella ambigua TaxID=1343610 RepID=A0A9P6Q2R1_9FUNG|nr:hypothetical protein DFQ27_005257 [Actinomortierella ambigua]